MSWSRRKKKKAAASPSLPSFVTPASWRQMMATPAYGSTGATGPTSLTGSNSFSVPGGYAVPGYPIPNEPASPGIKDLGLAIEPIVGYRAYQMDWEGSTPCLMSYNCVIWPARAPLQAYCGNNPFADHEVPSETCQCGIYAWNTPAAPTSQTLWGDVYLWGDVLIGERGYRAEFAYPKNLTITAVATRSIQRIRDELEDAYGIPVAIKSPPEEIGFSFSTGKPILGT